MRDDRLMQPIALPQFVVMNPTGGLATWKVPPTTDVLQHAVGGDVECVEVPNGRLLAWVNEDGLALGLPENRPALDILTALGTPLAHMVVVGPVAFTGVTDDGGAGPLTNEQFAAVMYPLGTS